VKLPVLLQVFGLSAITCGAFLLFGLGLCVLVAGIALLATGVVLELERPRVGAD
jgi:hypothetical protein